MATPAVNLRRVEHIERVPDGVYEGIWGGYFVAFSVAGINYEAQTRDGIRTMRAPCKVTVKDGKIEVEAIR